jgi:hypothetical protein
MKACLRTEHVFPRVVPGADQLIASNARLLYYDDSNHI